MADFVIENEREINIDLDNLPNSLVFKLQGTECDFTPQKFAMEEHRTIEFYERKFEKTFPGLLAQFPMLYYMVEQWFQEASQKTHLEHLEARN
jgi:hypothetical protein